MYLSLCLISTVERYRNSVTMQKAVQDMYKYAFLIDFSHSLSRGDKSLAVNCINAVAGVAVRGNDGTNMHIHHTSFIRLANHA